VKTKKMIRTIQASFADAIGTIVGYIDEIIVVTAILIIGLFAGRILGKVVSLKATGFIE